MERENLFGQKIMSALKLPPVRLNSNLQVKKEKWTPSNIHGGGTVLAKKRTALRAGSGSEILTVQRPFYLQGCWKHKNKFVFNKGSLLKSTLIENDVLDLLKS